MASDAPTEILTLKQVADYLKVNRSTVYRLIRQGQMPAFKVGSDYRFNRSQIDEWMKKTKPGSRVAKKLMIRK